MIIREVDRPKLSDLSPQSSSALPRDFLSDVKLVGSGKGAIALILSYLASQKIISNKLDEIIMPDWLGSWVYSQVNQFAFPAKRLSARSKAIFVYHQYGFPQDMDKIMDFAREHNLIVIEDCAHAVNSYYQGKQVGTFGDFALYSFSKWFFCFALGGVKSNFTDFSDFIEKKISATSFGLTAFKNFSKWLYELGSFSSSSFLKQSSNYLLSMSYGIYDQALQPGILAQKLFDIKLSAEIKIRQKRYADFMREFGSLSICDHLEKEGITPYVIPIFAEEKNALLVKELEAIGVNTGIYNFDINRNMLEPKYIPCVWLPCHSGISDEKFCEILGVVKKYVS